MDDGRDVILVIFTKKIVSWIIWTTYKMYCDAFDKTLIQAEYLPVIIETPEFGNSFTPDDTAAQRL